MCVEYISIALCAPTKAPELSFTCGQLHLIAGRREVCASSKGRCVCFFATCGRITQMSMPTTVEWADIPKIRCLACTKREDHVGTARENRDLLESPLLTRNPVIPSEQDSFVDALRGLWRGSDSCPFHKTKEEQAATEDSKTFTSVCNQMESPKSGEGSVASSQVAPSTKSFPSSAIDAFKPKRGLAASQWANVEDHVPQPKFTPRPRRPIPIVRPPSSHSSQRVKSQGSRSANSASEKENDVNIKSPDLHASLKGKWIPPHLRHLNEEQANVVTVGGSAQ